MWWGLEGAGSEQDGGGVHAAGQHDGGGAHPQVLPDAVAAEEAPGALPPAVRAPGRRASGCRLQPRHPQLQGALLFSCMIYIICVPFPHSSLLLVFSSSLGPFLSTVAWFFRMSLFLFHCYLSFFGVSPTFVFL